MQQQVPESRGNRGRPRAILGALILAVVGVGLSIYADATQRRAVVSRSHAHHLGLARVIGKDLVTSRLDSFLPENLIQSINQCPLPGSRVCLSMNGGSAMVCRHEGANGLATSQVNFSRVVEANQASDYLGAYLSKRGERRLLSMAWIPALDMFVGLDVAEQDVFASGDRLGAWPAVVCVVTCVGIVLIFFTAAPARMARPVPAQSANIQEALATIVPASPAWAVFLLDREGLILDANSVAANLAGETPAGICGRPFGALFPDEARLYADDAGVIFESGEPKQGSIEPLGKVDGDLRWVSVDKFRWSDESGHVKGMLVMARDVTDERRAKDADLLQAAT